MLKFWEREGNKKEDITYVNEEEPKTATAAATKIKSNPNNLGIGFRYGHQGKRLGLKGNRNQRSKQRNRMGMARKNRIPAKRTGAAL